MNLPVIMPMVLMLGLLSAIYHKKFLLSILLSLELMLLKLIAFKIYMGMLKSFPNFVAYSIFMLALSAVEASMGMSLMSMLSRKFSEVSVTALKSLKK